MLITTTGLIVTPTGPHAIGGATSANSQLNFTGAFTGSGLGGIAIGMNLNSTITGAVSDILAGNNYSYILATATSGTHSKASQVRFVGNAITINGTAVVSSAATVLITAAMSGATKNYALWVDAGNFRIDGSIIGSGTLGMLSILAGTVGSAATPTYAWQAAANMGMYRAGANIIGWSTGGVERMRLGAVGGLQMGSPTGGDKGVGTINVATDIFKNNTAYTNPDYVFELEYLHQALTPVRKDYEGLQSLYDIERFTRKWYHLPGISRDVSGIFERGDMLLEKVEETYLHLFDHEDRIDRVEKLETRIAVLEAA